MIEIKNIGANSVNFGLPFLSFSTVIRIRNTTSNITTGANSLELSYKVRTPSAVNVKFSPIITPVDEQPINTPIPPIKPTNT